MAFAAVDRVHAQRLYRAQNVIWVWLGIVAMLAAVAYFARPYFGPVIVSRYPALDVVRVVAFAVGGAGISGGVWNVRRVLEVWGHCLFACGATITAAVELSLHLDAFTIITTFGLAIASALRVWYIVAWIGAGRVTAAVVEDAHALPRD